MEHTFQHSLAVMGQLAQDTARTPPSNDGPALEYVDRSLTILGRTADTHQQRMRQEFLGQRDFIASQFREAEKKTGDRFRELDERFRELEKKMDKRFREVDERFRESQKKIDTRLEKQDFEIQGIKVQIENAAAITRNGRLHRLHQPINLIKVRRPTDDPTKFVWSSHSKVPKHMKDVYLLGQRAKGVFESSWDKTPNEQKPLVKRAALDTIEILATFYDVVLYSDERSETDGTEVNIEDWSADEYMEALLSEWGMDWQKVYDLGRQHILAQPQQTKAKRAGDVSSRAEKKTRAEGTQSR